VKKKSAGGAPLKREAEFGCRTLVVFKGAGFDFSFSRISLLYLPEFPKRPQDPGIKTNPGHPALGIDYLPLCSSQFFRCLAHASALDWKLLEPPFFTL